jgi:hypothetical protein
MLLFPIDVPQLEKWVSFVKGLPQDLKILFRVANAHANDLNAATPLSLDGWWDFRTEVEAKQAVPFCGQGARSGTSFTRSSEPASWIA